VNPQGNQVATLWKNGEAARRLNDGQHSAFAYSLFVSGDRAYVAGCERQQNRKSAAALWTVSLTENAAELKTARNGY
jgi:hypothetical protein